MASCALAARWSLARCPSLLSPAAACWRALPVRTLRRARSEPSAAAVATRSHDPGDATLAWRARRRSRDAADPAPREQWGARGAARGWDPRNGERDRGPERGSGRAPHRPGLGVEDLRFERAAPDDKTLRTVVTIAKSRQYREKHGKILLEGTRLIRDALEAGAVLQTLFFDNVAQLEELPLELIARAALIRVRMKDIRLWSDLVTPQGILAIFKRPDYASDEELTRRAKGSECLPISLVCDNVRDPGNMGTIIRSAAAVGCSKVLLIKGCVDVWEPKVLRAGAGAHFRVPLLPCLRWKEVPRILGDHTVVHVADNRPSGRIHSALDDEEVSLDEVSDHEDEPKQKSLLHKLSSVPAHAYTQPWADLDPGPENRAGETALVVSGEAQGVGIDALQLAADTGGHRLHVGMAAGVESLNVAVAASLLLFEARRQQLTTRHGQAAAERGAVGVGSQPGRTHR